MKVTLEGHGCVVQREKGDRGFYGRADTAWGGGESNLLHHVKLKLNEQGYDLIKKRMHKDGHMVDDLQQYLRARNAKKLKPGDVYCVHDGSYAIRDSAEDYNAWEAVYFVVERAHRETTNG